MTQAGLKSALPGIFRPESARKTPGRVARNSLIPPRRESMLSPTKNDLRRSARVGAGADRLSALAEISFRLVAKYDHLRLSLYRDWGNRGHRISIASIGLLALLRFEDVGYFNRVYARGRDVVDHLDAIEGHFEGSRHGCVLLPSTVASTCDLERACASRSWVPDGAWSWLAAATLSAQRPVPGDFEIRAPRPREQDIFLDTYLTAFGCDAARHMMAKENMRHLFSVPDLHFLLALRDGQPIGVGMLYRSGRSALFCAGATLPSHARQGCHEALLTARLRLAQGLGCTAAFSWATSGGQSEADMESVGFRIVGTTVAWRLPPDRVW